MSGAMLLYHGSNLAIEEPRLIGQVRGLDFGAGFHLTTSEPQAARFSEIVVRRRKNGAATVNVYEFDMEAAKKTLTCRIFASADAQWLRFVADNRRKSYTGEIYDLVMGAVANDTVMPTIQAFLSGFITEEAALITLKAGKLVDQVCLKSEKAMSKLMKQKGCNHGKYLTSYRHDNAGHSDSPDGKPGCEPGRSLQPVV